MSEIIGQVSNLCLSRKEVATGGIDVHRQFLEDVADVAFEDDRGYDGGYEITPTRALTAAITVASFKRNDRETAGLYSSVHQGWAESGAYAAVMQRTHPSLKTIERLGHGRMPAVLFGDARHKGEPVDFSDYKFASRGVQISPEVMVDWGINPAASSYDGMIEQMQNRGLDRIVVDPFHLYRSHREKDIRIDPEKVFDAADSAKIIIDRVHLRAGNGDLGDADDKKETVRDLEALLKSPEALAASRMGQLVLNAYDIFLLRNTDPDGQFHFVTEVTQAGLLAHHDKWQEQRHQQGLGRIPFTRQIRAQYHAAMASNARNMLRHHA